MVARVADLSVDELKAVIRETVAQTLLEMFQDPDMGLELREDFTFDLQHSLETFKTKEYTVSAEDVAAELDLSW